MLKLSLQQIRQLILNSYFNLLWLMVVGGWWEGEDGEWAWWQIIIKILKRWQIKN